MRLETLFEKFDQSADVPDAVAQIRKLILDLAIQGRIFGKPDVNAANGIPDGWQIRNFGEVVTLINGDRSKNYPSKKFRVADGVPFINAGHLSNGDVDLTNMDYITPEHFSKLGSGKIEPGDVLYCLRGSLGKCAVVQSVERGAIASSLLIIRPSEQTTSRFVYLFLTSPLGARMAAKYDNGSAQPNLSAANVKRYVIPLPPLAEQKRIVAKVDELMVLCDRLEAQQQERETRQAALARASLARFAQAPTPANLHYLFHPSYTVTPADLRKSILMLAVQGKLVPQDIGDKSANPLLGMPTKLNCTALPALPGNWTWARVDETGKVDLGRQRAPQHHRGPNMRPYLRVQNVYEARIDVSDVKEMNFSPAEYKTFALQSGDLLLNEGQSRELVGRPAIYRGEVPGACFQNTLVRYRHHNFVLPEYALVVFRAYMRNGRFQKISKQTTNIAHLSSGRFAALEFPLPPVAEQHRIVAKVDRLMALVDDLETQLATSRATGKRLLEAIVAELTGVSKEHRAPARQVVTDNPEAEGEDAAVVPDAGTARTSRVGARRSQVAPLSPSDTDAAARLAALLREKGNLSNGEAQAATGLDPATIRTHLQALVAAGRARTEGQRRGMRYIAVD